MSEQLFSERTTILFFYKFDDYVTEACRGKVVKRIDQFFFCKSREYKDVTPSIADLNGYAFQSCVEFNDWVEWGSYVEIHSDDRKKAIEFANMIINYIKRFKGVIVYAN